RKIPQEAAPRPQIAFSPPAPPPPRRIPNTATRSIARPTSAPPSASPGCNSPSPRPSPRERGEGALRQSPRRHKSIAGFEATQDRHFTSVTLQYGRLSTVRRISSPISRQVSSVLAVYLAALNGPSHNALARCYF